MAHPYYTVPEIVSLLNEKGFTEAELHLPGPEGMIERTIRRGHAEMIRNATRSMLLENLVVDIPGRFDENRDLVNFQFTFVYNHETDKMRIMAVRSLMNEDEAKSLHLLGDSKKLMRAHDIYGSLLVIRNNKALAVLAALSPKDILQKSRHL